MSEQSQRLLTHLRELCAAEKRAAPRKTYERLLRDAKAAIAHERQRGPRGLFQGFTVGIAAVAILLAIWPRKGPPS